MTFKYQILVPRFWTDARIRGLEATAKLVFASLITCNDAVNSSRTGIYEIHREDIRSAINTLDGINSCPEHVIFDLMGWHDDELKRFLKKDELDDADKKRAQGYFNREKSELLQYDVVTHCIFVKSMFKYACLGGLIKSSKAISACVDKALNLYENKCPLFLAEFSRINHKTLAEASKKLSGAERNAIEHLFLLQKGKNLLSANPKLVSAQKMQETLKDLAANLPS